MRGARLIQCITHRPKQRALARAQTDLFIWKKFTHAVAAQSKRPHACANVTPSHIIFGMKSPSARVWASKYVYAVEKPHFQCTLKLSRPCTLVNALPFQN